IAMYRGRTTSRRHNSFPVFRSRARVLSLSPSLAVRDTRSAVTTGDDRAKGTCVFQTRFFVELNSVGNEEPSATPVPFGPRNCSHSLVRVCAYVDEPATINNVAIRNGSFIFILFGRNPGL